MPKVSSPFAMHGAGAMPTGQAFSKSSSAFSSTPVTKGETSNSDSEPPLQPTKQSKKPRIASSSDDDSDSKARVAQKRSAAELNSQSSAEASDSKLISAKTGNIYIYFVRFRRRYLTALASSSDDDSDSKARVAQKRSAGGVKRGAKQPIKRGGKRF
jgi:hypothetical protein